MVGYKTGEFFGWEGYPQNISLPGLDVDAKQYNEALKKDSERLFVPEEIACQLKLLDPTCKKRLSSSPPTYGNPPDAKGCLIVDQYSQPQQAVIRSPIDLAVYLKKDLPTYFFQITQAYSWGQLLVTEELFRKVATVFKIHPGFLSIVHIFGERITPVEESFAACITSLIHEPSPSQTCSYNISYNFKYVARHGRPSPMDPFSIRQSGVHHKYDAQSNKSTWIVLQLPETLNERLSLHLSDVETSDTAGQFQYHALILQDLSENWRCYINYLEASFSGLMDRGFFSNLTNSTRKGALNAEISDIRKMQIMMDKLQKLTHLLELNTKICGRLQSFFQKVKSTSSDHLLGSFDRFENSMDNCKFKLETYTSQLRTLMKRVEGVGALIQHILDFRSAEANHNMNVAMHELSKQGAEENKLVRKMTAKSTQDTRSMKVVAFISSIFLPATFVATFFGSNFFGFEDTPDGHALSMASNIWIYVTTALAFTAITVAFWYVAASRSRSIVKEIDENGSLQSCGSV